MRSARATTGRTRRAWRGASSAPTLNLLETLGPFAALVLVVLYTGNGNANTALGAQLDFWGRVLYFPA